MACIRGKTILITGAARRIGREIALHAAKQGANVIIHHSQSPDLAEETAELIRQQGVQAWIVQQDFSDPSAAAGLIDQAWQIQPLFALVHNAAIFEPLRVHQVTLQSWQRHMDINLTTPFFLSQAFAAKIGSQNQGRIVHILDWRALRPGADHLPYTISKAALVALTRSLAVALAPNILVNGLALGAILPPSDNLNPKGIIDLVPAGRWASLDEVGSAIQFLLEGPEYITGEIIHLDGGRHLV